jgi:hypothetical protein
VFSLAFGKIKIILAAIFAAVLPILYIIGRRDGAKAEKNAVLEDELNAQKVTTEFYKAMEKNNAEIESNTPRNRDELTDRLRNNGL